MDLKSYLNERKKLVEVELCRSIEDASIPETLRSAMKYSLEAGGKRLRPALVFAGAEAVGGSAEGVLNAAVALEMIHTFSLIHDDLPAMDNDSLRRGKPTNHKVFGDDIAILAGDGLLAEAFYVLAKTKTENARVLIETIMDIAAATGGRGMTGGQVLDVQATGAKTRLRGESRYGAAKIGEGELTKLHLMKTGALIKASATSGARLSGASKEDISALARYGDAIGLAFQIADDILDIEGSEKDIGKDKGSDESKGKSTYPAILGIEESKKMAKALVGNAVSQLERFGARAEPLRLIAKYIIERDS